MQKANKHFEWYAFPQDVLDVVQKIKHWYKSRLWYKQKHIPWRRGILVHGKPGSGKTLLLRSIAQDLGIPMFVFDLSSMTNEEFVNFWKIATADAPCMVVCEDFDAVFSGRKPVVKKTKLTFDCLLNCISGASVSEGVLFCVTANNIQNIDPAIGVQDQNQLSSRPGRIDDVIEMNNMNEECRKKTISRILDGDNPENILQKTQNMTAAQVVEYCSQIALIQRFDAADLVELDASKEFSEKNKVIY